MTNGFVHSVKVPRLYKTAADIVKKVQENGGSLKTLLYEKKHPNVSGIYALTANALQKKSILDRLFVESHILEKEPRLNPWLARVLITELIWGKGVLTSECKPVQTVKAYEQSLRAGLEAIKDQIEQQPTAFRADVIRRTIAKKPRYVRVNTIVTSVDEILSKFENEGWTLLPKATSYSSYLKSLRNLDEPNFVRDFHIPEILVFPHKVSFYSHESYLNGEIVLQDKASCLPAFLLNPPPGSTVLDMCAAPGMKTTQLAAVMKNKGTLYATELENKRYQTLCELVKKMQCTCVQPMRMDALELDKEEYGNVEYILVDPSCSGSGMTDRQSSGEEFSDQRLRKLQSFQVFLLRHALLNFPKAKRIVYSTCSIRENENEEVVDEILGNIGDAYKLVPVKEILGKNWNNFSNTTYACGDKCLYARTDSDKTNGFFIAIFERNFDVPLPDYRKKGSKAERRIDPDAVPVPKEEKDESRKKKKRGKKRPKNAQASSDTEKVEDEEKNTDDHSDHSVEEKEAGSTGENAEFQEHEDEEPSAKRKKTKIKQKKIKTGKAESSAD